MTTSSAISESLEFSFVSEELDCLRINAFSTFCDSDSSDSINKALLLLVNRIPFNFEIDFGVRVEVSVKLGTDLVAAVEVFEILTIPATLAALRPDDALPIESESNSGMRARAESSSSVVGATSFLIGAASFALFRAASFALISVTA
jgi:hypothetical protein